MICTILLIIVGIKTMYSSFVSLVVMLVMSVAVYSCPQMKKIGKNVCINMHKVKTKRIDDDPLADCLHENCKLPHCTAVAVSNSTDGEQVCMHANVTDTECVCNTKLDFYGYYETENGHFQFNATECHPFNMTTEEAPETTITAGITTTSSSITTTTTMETTTTTALVCSSGFSGEEGLCIFNPDSSSTKTIAVNTCSGVGRLIEIKEAAVSVLSN